VKRFAEQTLYEILEVREDAPANEIQAACDRAREIYGPGSLATYTLMTPDEAELLARRIDEARATLLDPEARARYDEALRHPGEAVAALGGAVGSASAGAAFSSLPPVIPALQPAPASPPPEEPEESGDAPPIALAAPLAVPEDEPQPSPAVPAPPAAPGPKPILLEREILTPLPLGSALRTVSPDAPPPLPVAEPAAAAAPPPPAAPPPVPAAEPVPEPAQVAIAAPAAVPPDRAPTPVPPDRAQPPVPPDRAAAPAPRTAIPAVADGAWTGDALRQMREARGLTVQQIAERTRVTRHHIENIEGERFGALPAPVYLRGILLSLARELRLDGQKVARAYLERSAAALAAAKK
jgi:helix-turn-helix protein